MKLDYFFKLVGVSVLVIGAVGFSNAQVKTRSITSDDFAAQRPAPPDVGGKKSVNVKPKRFSYKFVRSDRNAVRWNGARKPPVKKPDNQPAKVTEIGVTMWKMRPPRASERGYFLLPVIDDKQERSMWVAERVSTDSTFTAGDKVRFAVESSDSGYLYVLGRETYSDGSYGAPYPIFPASADDNNLVRPGMLFDIPDQREDVPYFNINPKKPNYSGELLTLILAPKPLTTIKLDSNGKLKNTDDLIDLEFSADVEIFTRADTSDQIYTKAESKSSCGVKTRELERASSGDPCSASSRLTSGEPMPQSIYRVKAVTGQPAVAFLKLAVK
jgi:Domain of unknown function (DUF4384)